MNNAMVNVPLTEIEGIKKRLEEAENRANDLASKQGQIKLTLVERKHGGYASEPGYMPSGGYSWAQGQYLDKSRPISRLKEVPEKYVVIGEAYINLEDYMKIARDIEREKFEADILRLESDIRRVEKTRDNQTKQHIEDTSKLIADFEDKLKAKDREIARLKGEQVDLTKDEEIKKLKVCIEDLNKILDRKRHQLDVYHSKNWLERLFNL